MIKKLTRIWHFVLWGTGYFNILVFFLCFFTKIQIVLGCINLFIGIAAIILGFWYRKNVANQG